VFFGVVSATWEFNVGARSTSVDTSNGTMLDVNGDGYADVVVGAPYEGSGDHVVVYLGGASGLATTRSATLSGPTDFGRLVASAGDVNGDGYADLAVGASSQTFVYLGGAGGLATTPATTLPGAGSDSLRGVASAGDVNGDGFADVVVGVMRASQAFVYLGSAGGLATTPATSLSGPLFFGGMVEGAGDVNGDGYADVVVGSQAAQAFMYMGSARGLSTLPATTLSGAGSFGLTVAIAGDVNGDGYADIAVGSGSNQAFIYLGGASGLATTPATTLSGPSNFAYRMASAGDVNADGYDDFVVGTFNSANQAFVYLGGASGLAATAATTISSPTGGIYPIAVGGAGDVNKDGYSDVFVGALISSQSFVHLGSSAGVSTTPAATLSGSGYFGFSVAIADDANDHRRTDMARPEEVRWRDMECRPARVSMRPIGARSFRQGGLGLSSIEGS
jgi:hypothetical protein